MHQRGREKLDNAQAARAATTPRSIIKPIIGAGSQHMSLAKDNKGTWLDAARTYRLRVPANVLAPSRQPHERHPHYAGTGAGDGGLSTERAIPAAA